MIPADGREHTLCLFELITAPVHTLAGTMLACFRPDMDVLPGNLPEGHLRACAGTEQFYVNFHND